MLSPLPDRDVRGSGQGGGGALSNQELADFLLTDPPRLAAKSILHTDSAKAYRHVGPQRWPEAGALHENFEEDPLYAGLDYVHTNVCHKRKPGQQVAYAARRYIRCPDGTQLRVLGGTQVVDGYWPQLRAHVGRKGFNTGKLPEDRKRQRLHKLIRVHQWLYWNLSVDRFSLLGSVYKAWWSA